MKKLITLCKRVIIRFYSLDHDQRKQTAAALNNIATLIIVQYFIRQNGFNAIIVLGISIAIWILSVKIVRKGKGE